MFTYHMNHMSTTRFTSQTPEIKGLRWDGGLLLRTLRSSWKDGVKKCFSPKLDLFCLLGLHFSSPPRGVLESPQFFIRSTLETLTLKNALLYKRVEFFYVSSFFWGLGSASPSYLWCWQWLRFFPLSSCSAVGFHDLEHSDNQTLGSSFLIPWIKESSEYSYGLGAPRQTRRFQCQA